MACCPFLFSGVTTVDSFSGLCVWYSLRDTCRSDCLLFSDCILLMGGANSDHYDDLHLLIPLQWSIAPVPGHLVLRFLEYRPSTGVYCCCDSVPVVVTFIPAIPIVVDKSVVDRSVRFRVSTVVVRYVTLLFCCSTLLPCSLFRLLLLFAFLIDVLLFYISCSTCHSSFVIHYHSSVSSFCWCARSIRIFLMMLLPVTVLLRCFCSVVGEYCCCWPVMMFIVVISVCSGDFLHYKLFRSRHIGDMLEVRWRPRRLPFLPPTVLFLQWWWNCCCDMEASGGSFPVFCYDPVLHYISHSALPLLFDLFLRSSSFVVTFDTFCCFLLLLFMGGILRLLMHSGSDALMEFSICYGTLFRHYIYSSLPISDLLLVLEWRYDMLFSFPTTTTFQAFICGDPVDEPGLEILSFVTVHAVFVAFRWLRSILQCVLMIHYIASEYLLRCWYIVVTYIHCYDTFGISIILHFWRYHCDWCIYSVVTFVILCWHLLMLMLIWWYHCWFLLNDWRYICYIHPTVE